MTRPTSASPDTHGLGAEGDRSRLRENEAAQAAGRLGQCIAPDERPLLRLHREPEPRLVWRVLGGDVRTPHPVALLEPQRVDRLVAACDEPVLAAGRPHLVPEAGTELGRAVELPAELADVRHPDGETRHRPERELSGGHVRERVAGERGDGQRLQDLARCGPPDPETGIRRRDVDDGDRAVDREVLPEPGGVVLAERRAGDDPEALLTQPRDREVALDPASLVQHLRVRDPSDLAGDTVRAQPLEERRSALPGDVELRERRLVEDGRRLAARPVLGADRG